MANLDFELLERLSEESPKPVTAYECSGCRGEFFWRLNDEVPEHCPRGHEPGTTTWLGRFVELRSISERDVLERRQRGALGVFVGIQKQTPICKHCKGRSTQKVLKRSGGFCSKCEYHIKRAAKLAAKEEANA